MPDDKPKPKGGNLFVKGNKIASEYYKRAHDRPRGLGEFREMCREYSPEAIRALVDALGDKDRVPAAKVLLSYAWGAPAMEITGPNGSPFGVSLIDKLAEMTTDEMRKRRAELRAIEAEVCAKPEPPNIFVVPAEKDPTEPTGG